MLKLIKSLKLGEPGFKTARENAGKDSRTTREEFLEVLTHRQVAHLLLADGSTMLVALHNSEGGVCNCCSSGFETIIAYDVYELVSTESVNG